MPRNMNAMSVASLEDSASQDIDLGMEEQSAAPDQVGADFNKAIDGTNETSQDDGKDGDAEANQNKSAELSRRELDIQKGQEIINTIKEKMSGYKFAGEDMEYAIGVAARFVNSASGGLKDGWKSLSRRASDSIAARSRAYAAAKEQYMGKVLQQQSEINESILNRDAKEESRNKLSEEYSQEEASDKEAEGKAEESLEDAEKHLRFKVKNNEAAQDRFRKAADKYSVAIAETHKARQAGEESLAAVEKLREELADTPDDSRIINQLRIAEAKLKIAEGNLEMAEAMQEEARVEEYDAKSALEYTNLYIEKQEKRIDAMQAELEELRNRAEARKESRAALYEQARSDQRDARGDRLKSLRNTLFANTRARMHGLKAWLLKNRATEVLKTVSEEVDAKEAAKSKSAEVTAGDDEEESSPDTLKTSDVEAGVDTDNDKSAGDLE